MNTLAEPLAEPLAEHRRAVLTADQPEAELIAGDVGIVVFIHGEGSRVRGGVSQPTPSSP